MKKCVAKVIVLSFFDGVSAAVRNSITHGFEFYDVLFGSACANQEDKKNSKEMTNKRCS